MTRAVRLGGNVAALLYHLIKESVMKYRTITLLCLFLTVTLHAQVPIRDGSTVISQTLQLRPCDDPVLQASHSINREYAIGLRPIGWNAFGKASAQPPRPLPRTNNHELFEVGLMANTYCMIGENRNQIACDPLTGQVGIVFRGNDRSQDGDGNTLYIRYSMDQGETFGPRGDNVATSASPRYPNIFLPNTGSGPHTALLWPQVVSFGNGSEDFGEINAMKTDHENQNPSYAKLATPPNWSIPWAIVMDQSTGNLYSAAEAVEPSNGAMTSDIFLLRSTDGGAQWQPVNLGQPFFEPNLVPNGYVARNLRVDISPDGSTLIAGWKLIIESEPGRANLLDEGHEIAWRISTDKGESWGAAQRLKLSDIVDKPALRRHERVGKPVFIFLGPRRNLVRIPKL